MSADGMVAPTFEISRILEEQRRQDEKRRVKRAANRKSASTSRARKKALVDDMTAKNERMKQHALILSMLPDLVLAVCRSGEMTYVSPAAQWLLLHSPEEVTGANIFELVTQDCHSVLRKMISDNLARPVQSRGTSNNAASEEPGCRSSDGGDGRSLSGGDSRRPTISSPGGNHRDRLQQRYLQGQAAAAAGDAGDGLGNRTITPTGQGPKMLRLIRCDKTTVWCESRLSVRSARADTANPTPMEIILTLRTVSEGSKTTAGNGLPSNPIRARARKAESASVDAVEDRNDNENDEDDDYGEEDDGYRCEEEEDESNNSGSGNDFGRMEHRTFCCGGSIGLNSSVNTIGKKHMLADAAGGGANKKKGSPRESGSGSGVEKVHAPGDSGPLVDGREERSLSMKRQRMEDMKTLQDAQGDDSSNKRGEGEDSSTGGDTGGSTTQEGSGSCSNEADSNGEGEGSNNGSKWEDASAGDPGYNIGSQCGDSGESEDGSSDGNPAGNDLGDEVQNAVQSLILMGGNFSSEGGGVQ